MAKLSKVEARNHSKALEFLQQDILSDDEKEFVFNHYHEAANHVNGSAGAFFTPLDLAWDAALELESVRENHERRVIDLCAGIGVLSYCVWHRYRGIDITCVEINPEYVEVGKKLVPQANWVLMDITDLEALSALGRFDNAISNPPFGRVPSFKGKSSPRYHGGEAEFKVIDLAAEVTDADGVFILPQGSAGFRLSGVQYYERVESDKYKAFAEQTGLNLEAGMGIDTTVHSEGWKSVKPRVEVACVDFGSLLKEEPANSMAKQMALF